LWRLRRQSEALALVLAVAFPAGINERPIFVA